MAGASALTLRATRRLKSGLSMVTRQSGFAATIARAVSPIRRSRRGRSRTIGAETHQCDLGGIEQAVQPLALQMVSADADELDRPAAHRTQRADQIGAEQIAGFLAGDDRQAQRLALSLKCRLPAGR